MTQSDTVYLKIKTNYSGFDLPRNTPIFKPMVFCVGPFYHCYDRGGIEREGQAGRQAGGQAGRQAGRQTGRQADTEKQTKYCHRNYYMKMYLSNIKVILINES